MTGEIRIYELGLWFKALIVLNVVGPIIVSGLFFSRQEALFGVMWLFIALGWLVNLANVLRNGQLATTDDSIVIARGLRRPLEIRLTEIERIERRSSVKYHIWYKWDGKMRRQRLNITPIRGDEQLAFHAWMEGTIASVSRRGETT